MALLPPIDREAAFRRRAGKTAWGAWRFRLRPDGVYAAIEPDRRRRGSSAVLGATWSLAEPQALGQDRYIPLRLMDPQTGAGYPTLEERDRQMGELKATLARYQERYGPWNP